MRAQTLGCERAAVVGVCAVGRCARLGGNLRSGGAKCAFLADIGCIACVRSLASAEEYSLDKLDVLKYDLFVCSSSAFWSIVSRAGHRSVVLGFFEQAWRIGSSAFLVSHSRRVCEEANTLHGIPCVLGRGFNASFDRMMMMERFHVIQHFLRCGRPIVFAGSDVRFTMPVKSLLIAARSEVEVDAAFEATATRIGREDATGTVLSFTPDIIVAYPTERMATFVASVLRAFSAPVFEGLPLELRSPALLGFRKELTGPAQQDMLMDVLLSTLHGRPLSLRKAALARDILSWPEAEQRRPRRGPRIDGRADLRQRARLGGFELLQSAHGDVLRSPRLEVLMMQGKLTLAAMAPCARRKCLQWSPRLVHALHCVGKSPACLDLSQCGCPEVGRYWTNWSGATRATPPVRATVRVQTL